MKRYFIELMYHGKAYNGWQIQNNAVGVQNILDDRLSKVLQQEIHTMGSGRTDTGVHAMQQYAHFEADLTYSCEDLAFKLNAFLPSDISIVRIFEVDQEAHTRFSATERSYRYHLCQHKSPFLDGLAYRFPKALDFDKMNEAAALMLQHEDFESFTKTGSPQDHFRCEVRKAYWEKEGDIWVFHISANRFLRGMVRCTVGTLLDVGTGQITVAQFDEILKKKDRKAAGRSVPAEGLYLSEVKYPFII